MLTAAHAPEQSPIFGGGAGGVLSKRKRRKAVAFRRLMLRFTISCSDAAPLCASPVLLCTWPAARA
jgi:hypothetical protein